MIVTNTAPQFHEKKANSKFLLLVLFGEYIQPRGGEIWLSDLLYLLDLVGLGEHTARSTINRMAREGWFTVTKDGRNSRFSLTEHGAKIMQGGTLRVNETALAEWDGAWHMITYSLPEQQRKQRNTLRKQLNWLGYGSLGPGFWISPNNRHGELRPILESLHIEKSVHLFSGEYNGLLTTQELVSQCWDLDDLTSDYIEFSRFSEQELAQFKKAEPTPADCFVKRFMLTVRLFPILQKDPNLPLSMLPDQWPGELGRKLFTQYRTMLTPSVDQFIDGILKR